MRWNLASSLAVLPVALSLTWACREPEPKPPEDSETPSTSETPSPPDTDTPSSTGDTGTSEDTGTPPTSARAYLKLSAGEELTCALFDDGEIGCQGSTRWSLPAPPPGPFVDVAASWDTACAIRDSGTIACWGCDWISGLCDAPAGDRWVAIDAADSWFCARDDAGLVSCWGLSYGGGPQPGVAYTEFAVGVTGFVGIRASDGEVDASAEAGEPAGPLVEIAAGRSAACGIRASDGGTECVVLDVRQPPDGLALIDGYDADFCWLDAAGHAGCSRRSPDPARDGFDPAIETFASLTAGRDHACAVTVDGRGFCWPRDGRPETSGILERP